MCTRAPTHTHKSKEKCSYLVWKKNFIFFLQQQKLVYHLPIRRFPSIWTVICLLAAVSSRNNSNKFINRMIEDYRDGHGRVYDFVFISFASTINHSLRFSCALFCVHWSLLLCCVFKNILLRFAVLFCFGLFFFFLAFALWREHNEHCALWWRVVWHFHKNVYYILIEKNKGATSGRFVSCKEKGIVSICFFFGQKSISRVSLCVTYAICTVSIGIVISGTQSAGSCVFQYCQLWPLHTAPLCASWTAIIIMFESELCTVDHHRSDGANEWQKNINRNTCRMEEKIKHNHVDSVTESLLLCDVGLYGIIVAIADQKNTVFISVHRTQHITDVVLGCSTSSV